MSTKVLFMHLLLATMIGALQIASLLPQRTSALRGVISQVPPSALGRLGIMRRAHHLSNHLSPIVICGPSGVGKGTLISAMLRKYSGDMEFAVSHTTRRPREGEREGKEYYFTTAAKMRVGIDAGDFIEHVSLHGNLYGTSVKSIKHVMSKGKVCVLDIDTQGVRAIQSRVVEGELSFTPRFVFIAPPSIEDLRRRLIARGTETTEQIDSRVRTAEAEVTWACSGEAAAGAVGAGGGGEGEQSSNMAGPQWDAVVVNDDVSKASSTLTGLIARWHPGLSSSSATVP